MKTAKHCTGKGNENNHEDDAASDTATHIRDLRIARTRLINSPFDQKDDPGEH